MKVVILAGGLGTRITEESHLKPKPMIEIGGRPILWHIMKIYSYHGFNEFIICLGYKGFYIKEYFEHYFLHESDVTFTFGTNSGKKIHRHSAEPWKVTLVDTGQNTMTGGRIKRVKEFLNGESFMVTYGDGVSNINIKDLVATHEKHNKLATVTAVQPAGRFGSLEISDDNIIRGFKEKPIGDGSWINGGFFVLDNKVVDYIKDDDTVFEKEPLEKLANMNQLMAHRHNDFWQPMDTMRDKIKLNDLWDSNNAPWKVW